MRKNSIPQGLSIDSFNEIVLDNKTNLLSYTILKGTYIFKLKLEGKKDYAEEKKKLLKNICEYRREEFSSPIRELLDQIRRALLANGYYVKVCKIRALSRVLIGAGESFGKIPFEVGLYFDPVYNTPFIPSFSLKGAFRRALEILLEKNGRNIDYEKAVKDIFGSEDQSGLVGITDAYPTELPEGLLFEPDVLTPHYPAAETEFDVRPNPVPFLTVARGVVFEFYIYFGRGIYSITRKLGIIKDLDYNKSHGHPVEYAVLEGDLAKAIEKMRSRGADIVNAIPWVDRAVLYTFARGVGARTSAGYSRFEILEYKSCGV